MFVTYVMAAGLLIAAIALFTIDPMEQDASTSSAAPIAAAPSQPASSDEEIGEAPDRIIRPMYERVVRGGVNCEPFSANYVFPDQGQRRIESGGCGSAAGISIIFTAYGNAADRATEVEWLTKSSRESGFAPLIVYGDTWAVFCNDGATMSTVHRVLGGTIVI